MDVVAALEWFEGLYEKAGYLLIFFVSFIESSPFGWLTPGGFVLAGGGFYAHGGSISLGNVVVFGLLGSWLMLFVGYFSGQKTGLTIAKLLRQEKQAKRAERLLRHHGGAILTTSLLSNVTRFWIAYVAGMQQYNFARFTFFSGAASLTWVALWVTAGYLTGSERSNFELVIARLQLLAWILFGVAVATIYILGKKTQEEIGDEG